MKNSVIQNIGRLGIAAVSLVVCASSFAGKSPTGSIVMADLSTAQVLVDGVAAASFTDGYPRYGDMVGFVVDLDRVSAKGVTSVEIQCKQTTDKGSRVVYQNGSATNYVFTLTNQEQEYYWITWDGEAAQCHVDLLYRESTGKSTSTWLVDTLDFDVTAAVTAVQ